MAWTDEARQASAEARRASAKAKKSGTSKDHEAASRAHTTAENAHRDVVNNQQGDVTQRSRQADEQVGASRDAIEHHDKMSGQHQLTANKARGQEAVKSGEVLARAGLDVKIESHIVNAAKATKTARIENTPEAHEAAAKAHDDAKKAAEAIGHSYGADHHGKMADQHIQRVEALTTGQHQSQTMLGKTADIQSKAAEKATANVKGREGHDQAAKLHREAAEAQSAAGDGHSASLHRQIADAHQVVADTLKAGQGTSGTTRYGRQAKTLSKRGALIREIRNEIAIGKTVK
jgi:hypothetical protein